MRKAIAINTPLTDDVCLSLKVGDRVLLSGDVFTARDAAHKRLFEALLRGEQLPINLAGAVIFYAAPTQARPGRIIGSIGPTTSYRMDHYTPRMIELGLKGTIGKGSRSSDVRRAMQDYHAVYFGAVGGVAALTTKFIKAAAVIAYEDLGPEALMKLTLESMPVIVLNDCLGRDLYTEVQNNQGIF